jgi:hypothetical protein
LVGFNLRGIIYPQSTNRRNPLALTHLHTYVLPQPFLLGAVVLATSAAATFPPDTKALVCLPLLPFPPGLSALVVSHVPPLGVEEELGLLRQTDNDHNLAGECW